MHIQRAPTSAAGWLAAQAGYRGNLGLFSNKSADQIAESLPAPGRATTHNFPDPLDRSVTGKWRRGFSWSTHPD